MFNFVLAMLSVSSIILPKNNTMIFPGNNYDIKWTNMNSSDYLNIQMFVEINNSWKTNLANHHLFSVTTDWSILSGLILRNRERKSEVSDIDSELLIATHNAKLKIIKEVLNFMLFVKIV